MSAHGGEASRLLAALIRVPSPSGEEEAAAEALAYWARGNGLDVTVDEAAVRMEVEGIGDGPTLLMASHLDTVPPGEGWEVDPYAGVVEDGVLHGRGAVDAKASVAAMAVAAATFAKEGGPEKGRLVVLATYSEETRDTSMPLALLEMGRLPDAALIGEPTSLEPCIGQRGLMILAIRWTGEQRHAGRSDEGEGLSGNAIHRAARDLVRLADLRLDRDHHLLGGVSVTPTEIAAGVARNVTPPTCETVLDIRTTPAWTHAELIEKVRDAISEGEVEVLSDRLHPAGTPEDSALLEAIMKVRPQGKTFGSPTTSDWVFLRETDGVKLGPGESSLSHRADERIDLAEVEEAARLYAAVAKEYLS